MRRILEIIAVSSPTSGERLGIAKDDVSYTDAIHAVSVAPRLEQ